MRREERGRPAALRWWLPLAALLYGSGCGGDGLVSPLGSEVGTWVLATINGSPLPGVIAQTQTTKAQVTSASISLAADGTYRDVTNTAITTPDTAFSASDTITGSWVRHRNAILLVPESDETFEMQLGAASLSGARSSRTWTYTK